MEEVKMLRLEMFLVRWLMIWITILFQKKPSQSIVHAETNEAYHSTSREILNKLLHFKSPIQEKLTHCKLFILIPTLRSYNGKTTLTVNQLTNQLLQLNIDIVDNRDIISKHLSTKGLHSNVSGSRRLAINFLERIKKFWKNGRYASILEEYELAICIKNPIYLTIILRERKGKEKTPKYQSKIVMGRKSWLPHFCTN